MSTKVAVVIPTHKEELNELEKISLAQCRKILGRYPIIFAIPEGKNFSWIPEGSRVIHMPHLGQGINHYNILLMSPKFYETFADFDYILIYHVDAFVFYDALEEFCSLSYDYIGAPWAIYSYEGFRPDGKTPRVGNGGFSLRKVKACRDVLTILASLPNWKNFLGVNEDAIFSLCGATKELPFRTAPVEVAKLFAMEYLPARHVKKLGGLPFGCHNWTRFDANFYAEVFARFGYDLRPFREMIDDDDSETLAFYLTRVAMKRLMRRIERGQSILRYLPTKRFNSILMIRSPETVKILGRLLTEENFLADKIFIYDAVEQINFRDATNELPNLLIAPRATERYCGHVISFRQEYLKRCEELFHKLGK